MARAILVPYTGRLAFVGRQHFNVFDEEENHVGDVWEGVRSGQWHGVHYGSGNFVTPMNGRNTSHEAANDLMDYHLGHPEYR